MDTRIVKGLAVFFCLAASRGAKAQQAVPLGAPTVSTYVQNGNDPQITGTGFYEISDSVASANAAYTTLETGSALLSIDPTSTQAQSAGATITFQFEVIGDPTVAPFLPIIVSGSGGVQVVQSLNDGTINDAHVEFDSSLWGSIHTDQTTNGQQMFGITTGGLAMVNVPYVVTESLSAYSIPTVGGETTDHVVASLDPSISFSSGCSVCANYSIEVSPEPVPLPSSTWLLLGGLGALAIVARRRQTEGFLQG